MTLARFLTAALFICCFASCRREAAEDPALEAMREHREEMRAMQADLKAAQEKLEESQRKWSEEREEWQTKLAKEQERQAAVEEDQAEWDQNLESRDGELGQREEVLLQWEQKLEEREIEAAGREALEAWIPDEPDTFQEPVADFELFYDELDDYGSWYESDDYGYVYQPLIVIQDQSWRPYTRGRWVCSNYGWKWCSDEPFGWACYHYGRWCQLPKRGWCWVPGNQWAPSWCAWRQGNGHVGWAPLPPESMADQHCSWGRGTARNLNIHDDAFNFVRSQHMADPVWQNCLPSGRNAYLRARTQCCTSLHHRGHRVVAGGPQWLELRQAVGRPWPVHELEFDPVGGFRGERSRHGFAHGHAWRVFCPNIGVGWNASLRPERVAGRVETNAGGGAWATRFQEMRQAQLAQAKARSESFKDALVRNRESVAQAQQAYGRQLVNLRQGLASRPVQPLPLPRRSVAAPAEPAVAKNPQANMPSALEELLPPGVISLPEQGRTVEESIVARAEPAVASRPQVSVVDAVATNETSSDETNRRPSIPTLDATPLPRRSMATDMNGRQVVPGVPQTGSRDYAPSEPTVAVEEPAADADPPDRGQSTAGSRQEAMRQAFLRQQQAMQEAMRTRQQQPARVGQRQVQSTPSVANQPIPRRAQPMVRQNPTNQGGGRNSNAQAPTRSQTPASQPTPARSRSSSPAATSHGVVPRRGGSSTTQQSNGLIHRRGR